MRVILAVIATAVLAAALLVNNVPAPMPACEEDAVLVGVGDFEAGRWTAYECGPARDDFLP